MFKAEKYDVYLSTVTLREIEKCPEPKKTQLIDCLNEIQFTTLDITEDVTRLAEKIIEMEILTQKSFDDCKKSKREKSKGKSQNITLIDNVNELIHNIKKRR